MKLLSMVLAGVSIGLGGCVTIPGGKGGEDSATEAANEAPTRSAQEGILSDVDELCRSGGGTPKRSWLGSGTSCQSKSGRSVGFSAKEMNGRWTLRVGLNYNPPMREVSDAEAEAKYGGRATMQLTKQQLLMDYTEPRLNAACGSVKGGNFQKISHQFDNGIRADIGGMYREYNCFGPFPDVKIKMTPGYGGTGVDIEFTTRIEARVTTPVFNLPFFTVEGMGVATSELPAMLGNDQGLTQKVVKLDSQEKFASFRIRNGGSTPWTKNEILDLMASAKSSLQIYGYNSHICGSSMWCSSAIFRNLVAKGVDVSTVLSRYRPASLVHPADATGLPRLKVRYKDSSAEPVDFYMIIDEVTVIGGLVQGVTTNENKSRPTIAIINDPDAAKSYVAAFRLQLIGEKARAEGVSLETVVQYNGTARRY